MVSNQCLNPNDKTTRAAEVAGRGWMRRSALLLLLATSREEAPTDFRLFSQSMGIANSGIASSVVRRGARWAVCALIGLLILSFATAQEKGSQEKMSLAQARFSGRVESLLGAAPVDKGEWGL